MLARKSEISPGYDGRFQVGQREVDDPYEPGNTIVVPFNTKHDPIAEMFSRKQIDLGQYLAGEKLRSLIESAGGAGAQAIDYTLPKVDKSFVHHDAPLGQLEAVRDLREASVVVGWQRYRLLRAVVFDGLTGAVIATSQGKPEDRKAITLSVRDGLESLGVLWGFLSGEGYARKRAAIVSYLHEIALWGHEEREILIRYEPAKKPGA